MDVSTNLFTIYSDLSEEDLERVLLKIHFQFVAHVKRPSGVVGFQWHQLDKSVLILHLTVNQNRAALHVNIFPFQPETLIDTQPAEPPQHVRRDVVPF